MIKPVLEVYHNSTPTKAPTSYKWWDEKDDGVHSLVFPLVERMQSYQQSRSVQNLKYARLYSNMDMVGLSSGSYTRTGSNSSYGQNRLTLNVVQSCVDTAAAKIAKNKPRPMFLTSNGNHSMKRKAEKLTKYLDGQFASCRVYDKGQRVFVDGEVFGTGALKIYIDPVDQELKAERIFIDEITVDDVEGMYGEPQQMHQRKNYSRDVLVAMFPECANEIMAATTISKDNQSSISEQVLVIESWHLPSSKLAKDGRHTICISSCTLFAEKYEKQYFPFVFFRWVPKLLGFWGMGLAEQLIGLQLEINKVLVNIQAAQNLMCVPRIFVENGSKVNKSMITNEVGSIIDYRGTKPSLEVGQGMPAETYAYLDSLVKRCYEITGISMLSAMQKKPAGLDSGAALREYQDIESERFMLTGMRYEQFYMDIAKIMIDLSADLYEMNPKLSVKAKSSKFIETIKWKDVRMDEDDYEMTLYPVNLLPTTPAGKLETVQMLVQGQMMTPEQALDMLEFPDLDGFLARKNAAQDNIGRILELIVEKGKYTVPEKMMNLSLAEELTKETILLSMNDGVDATRIDLLRTFLEDVQTAMIASPPSLQPPEGAPVEAQGAPAPVSPLLPYQGN